MMPMIVFVLAALPAAQAAKAAPAAKPASSPAVAQVAAGAEPDTAEAYYHFSLGLQARLSGDGEQALVNLEQALLRNPQNLEAHIYLAAVHHLQARLDAAQWEAGEIRALEPAFDTQRWLASYPLTDAAQKARLLQALRLIGL